MIQKYDTKFANFAKIDTKYDTKYDTKFANFPKIDTKYEVLTILQQNFPTLLIFTT